MNTWTFRSALRIFAGRVCANFAWPRALSRSFAAIGLCALAACDDAISALDNLGGSSENAALSRAPMAFGAALLAPPDGFCIDATTLSQRFALMARCDALGAPGSGSAPRAVIAVSVTAREGSALPTVAELADAKDLANVTGGARAGKAVLLKAERKPPAPNLGAKHWRGVLPVQDQLFGIAVFLPVGANDAAGRQLLLASFAATDAAN